MNTFTLETKFLLNAQYGKGHPKMAYKKASELTAGDEIWIPNKGNRTVIQSRTMTSIRLDDDSVLEVSPDTEIERKLEAPGFGYMVLSYHALKTIYCFGNASVIKDTDGDLWAYHRSTSEWSMLEITGANDPYYTGASERNIHFPVTVIHNTYRA